ncbi:hypothetical protein ACQ4PT_017494 [Festuca glaucescens]
MASSDERRALVVVVGLLCAVGAAADGSDLTVGFAKVDLQSGDFLVQSPYDVPVDQRYRYDAGTGVRTFWVYTADKAFNAVTPTNPRTEIHNENGGTPATTMMLHVYNGTMRWYSGREVEGCVYGRWIQVNVVHDVGASTVAVYVDGAPRVAAVAVAPSRSYYVLQVRSVHAAPRRVRAHGGAVEERLRLHQVLLAS